jgi:hypothetical protein
LSLIEGTFHSDEKGIGKRISLHSIGKAYVRP